MSYTAPALTLAAAAFLVLAEHYRHNKSRPWAFRVLKPLASAGFIVTALVFGALDSDPGRLVILGLSLCAVGDVLLISNRPGLFDAGLLVFLIGHVAYATAFVGMGVALPYLLGAACVALLFAAYVMKSLAPHLRTRGSRIKVLAYTAAISSMFATGTAAAGAGASLMIPAGATLFLISDYVVARHRFIERRFANQAVILPTYYLAQVLIAASAGG